MVHRGMRTAIDPTSGPVVTCPVEPPAARDLRLRPALARGGRGREPGPSDRRARRARHRRRAGDGRRPAREPGPAPAAARAWRQPTRSPGCPTTARFTRRWRSRSTALARTARRLPWSPSTSTSSSRSTTPTVTRTAIEVLRAVGAMRCAPRSARHDVAARTGGEEFGLILAGPTGANAIAVAERARDALASIRCPRVRAQLLGRDRRLSARRRRPRDPRPARRQHPVLGQARRQGTRAPFRRRPRAGALERAPAERGRELLALERPIEPVFQPVVSLATGRIVGFEALARFTCPASARRTSGSRRRTAPGSAPSSRRPRSGRRSSRRATARRPPRGQRQPVGARLAGRRPQALAGDLTGS